ncbi:hypothetical protein BDY17DRAFT_290677 [Neohortaea acidophila]|uniref:Uncharacterized protein n=1 Tax=Neohortaea acidophila TaxID=245834 RepID=A0A6A6Q0Q7_9PEZI|nr:uncharacterized protein BDY17DRAFT_290677 [Neohortaea acidophila]KAF2485990.1 hypothetical protein BDY17DRAFT_290677 [Neohortaea acidophila]
MDLPPELRTWVYRDLLTIHPDAQSNREGRCHPTILQTCRQIYMEAKTVLYDGNTLECVLTSFGQECDDHDESFIVNGRLIPAYCPDDIAKIPEYIVRFSHISIVVRFLDCGFCNVEAYAMDLNWMLSGLASVLMDHHRLSKMKVTMEIREDVKRHEVYKELLYPLRRLRNIQNLTITSNDEDFPRHFERILARDVSKTTPALNTLNYWRAFHDEAAAWQELLHAAQGIPYVYKWNESLWKPLMPRDIRDSFHEIEEDYLVSACLSGPDEQDFLIKLFKLKKLLDDRQHDAFNQASKLWGDKVAARNAFQSDPVTGALTKVGPAERQSYGAPTSTLDEDFVGWDEGVSR